CRLLDIPPELRNRIYCHLLPFKQEIILTVNGYARPALLATCKQVRNEALKMFYANNTF
ncbi:hypothetical protein BAUCODRAFT_40938, partial [Baudoinia panamericana UAMH 10762]